VADRLHRDGELLGRSDQRLAKQAAAGTYLKRDPGKLINETALDRRYAVDAVKHPIRLLGYAPAISRRR
jgi:hypothetical protein